MRIDQIADLVLDLVEARGGVPVRDPDYDGPCEAVNPLAVEALAETALDLVANMVATIIDAGSERDAVNENETLLSELRKEFAGWTARD